MSRARVHLRVGGSVAFAGALALACGSRTSIEPCAFNVCDEGGGGTSPAGRGGLPATGGAGAPGTGAGGAGGTRPTPSGGGGAFAGGGNAAVGGEAGAAGEGGASAEPPYVLLLLDGSTSMYDAQVWTPTYEALTGPAGPLARYEKRVRFGLASYRGAVRTLEEDPACAQITSVPYALSNTASIRQTYAELGQLPRFPPWETPTGHALARVSASLLAEPRDAAKYILLISDGAPDTCMTTNPQCGQDRAVFAVQEAYRAGIQTYAIGIGFGNWYPGCTSETARCASDHFQDIANAGQGLDVVAPPEGYSSLPCIAETDGKLLARYAMQGGTAPFYWTQGPGEVANAVEAVLHEIVAR